MHPTPRATELQLAPKAIYRVADAAQAEISCREGSVWITLDNDPRDFVLEAGQTFSTDEHRPAVIYAFSQARLQLSMRQPEPALVRPAAQPRAQPRLRAIDFAR